MTKRPRRLQCLEDPDRLLRGSAGLIGAPRAPQELAEPTQCIALGQTIPELAPKLDLALQRGDAHVVQIREETRARLRGKQVGSHGGGELVAESKSARVLRHGLVVGADGGRTPRSLRGEATHGGTVPRRIRVVCEPSGVDAAVLPDELGKNAPVQLGASQRREGLLDCEARKLVPEARASTVDGE
jgi:hypothetical protein